MRPVILMLVILLGTTTVLAQGTQPSLRQASRTVIEGRASVVKLAVGFTTAVRVPEAVSSVILGDPGLFQSEHSPEEPLFVFVKPISFEAAETNLLIVTSSGKQFPLILKSQGELETVQGDVDLLVVCLPAGSTLIGETYPTWLIAESLALDTGDTASGADETAGDDDSNDPLGELLGQQQSRRLEALEGDGLEVSIGGVVAVGRDLAVTFSVLNATPEPLELTSPQIQLAGGQEGGFFKRSTRWTTVEQLAVSMYELTYRRLGPGERSDGIVVFERPAIKQSNEGLLLQIAQTAAIDEPVLVPIRWY